MDKKHSKNIIIFYVICIFAILVVYLSAEQIIALPAKSQILLLERVSVNNIGEQGDNTSRFPNISADGRYIAFYSLASNFVMSDTILSWDIFVVDRNTMTIELVSISSSGEQGNNSSVRPDISADGRFVVFPSLASNLVFSDTNGAYDVFVHDRVTHETMLVSRNTSGNQGNSASYQATISANGRFVAFASLASNLVADDSNNSADVFVHDRQTGMTERVSISSMGTQGFGDSETPYISSDGRFVTFQSTSSSLAPGGSGSGGNYHVYVRDRHTGETVRASVNSAGELANDSSLSPVISDDGRYVGFGSYATNLFPGTVLVRPQNYVRDMETGITHLVSISPTGEAGNDYSAIMKMTDDGRFVAFGSRASNLVAGDTNGVGDIFVYDRLTHYMLRVSMTPEGIESNGLSNGPALSNNGTTIVFYSEASNLVSGDTNNREDVFVIEWQLNYLWLPILYK